MKKRIWAMFLAVVLVLQSGITALAEELIAETGAEVVTVSEEAAAEEIMMEEIVMEDVGETLEEDCLQEEIFWETEEELMMEEVSGEAEPEVETKTEIETVSEADAETEGDVLVLDEIIVESIEEATVEEILELDLTAVTEYGMSAGSGACGDNAAWELKDGILTISGTGAMWDYDQNENRSEWSKSTYIDRIVIEEGITYVGAYAFYYDSTYSITLPSTLKEIGKGAFYDAKDKGFAGIEIEFPDGLQKIGSFAFGYAGLKSLVLPDSVTEVGASAFSNTELTSVTLSKGMTEIPNGMFYECRDLSSIEIPDNIQTIGFRAFGACDALTSITIPESVTAIDGYAFEWCSNLAYINLPDALTEIQEYTFFHCEALSSLDIPMGVTSIADNAFLWCESLTELIIPANVTTIGTNAFAYSGITFVRFMGDAPTFGTTPFNEMTATIYYLSSASGWTAVDASALGGTVTLSSFGSGSIVSSDTRLSWKLDAEGVLTISGSGTMQDFTGTSAWRNYASYVKKVVIGDGVTSIGANAFNNCNNMTEAVIPDGVTSIGENAFASCYNLKTISIPDSVTELGEYAFGRAGLTSVTLPGSLDLQLMGEDGFGIFSYCPDLKEVVLEEGIEIIPESMFYACPSLEKVSLPDSLRTIGAMAFSVCDSLIYLELPDYVTSVGQGAFNMCANLISVSFPEGITEIASYTFGSCPAFAEFTIPSTVTSIGAAAFGATALTEITIPETVTYMGAYAFGSCSNLKNVTFEGDLPEVSTMHETSENPVYPFMNVTAAVHYPLGKDGWDNTPPTDFGGTLTMEAYGADSAVFGNGLTWTYSANGTLLIEGAGAMPDFTNYTYTPWCEYKEDVAKVIIDEGITSIGNHSFFEMQNLTAASLPTTLKRIGAYAFAYDALLPDINIPTGVTEIGKEAFVGCFELKSIILPEGITEIADYTFAFCYGLTEIVIPASVTEIGTEAFSFTALTSIRFKGAMPEIGEYAFNVDESRITGDVYVNYPAYDTDPDWYVTWEGVTAADLGGKTGDFEFAFEEHSHSWDSGQIVKEATCTAAGVRIFTCNRCNGTRTESIAVLGHSAGSWTTAKAANCTAAGTKVKKCTRCKTILNTETIKAAGHKWRAWTVAAAATVFAAQKEQRKCSVCKGIENRTTGTVLKPTIRLNDRNIPLQVGRSTTKIKVSGLAAGDYVKSWKSNKTTIATVNKNGKITGKKAGTAKITVMLASGLSKSVTVKVQKKAVKTTAIWIVGYTDFTLQKGKKFDLAASMKPYVTPITSKEKITYSSSDEKVLKVNSKGVVTAVGPGKARIILRSGKVKDYATFTVPKVKTTSISNVPKSLTLKPFKTYTIKAKLNPSKSDEKITYKSSKKKVAIVNNKGKITTLLKGTTKITVTSGKVSISFTLKVK